MNINPAVYKMYDLSVALTDKQRSHKDTFLPSKNLRISLQSRWISCSHIVIKLQRNRANREMLQ